MTNVKLIRLESKSIFSNVEQRCKTILGKNSEIQSRFYLLKLDNDLGFEYKIGLIAENTFIPKYYIYENCILIGFNKELNILNVTSGELLKEFNFSSNFNEAIVSKNNFFVVHETGILVLDDKFNKLWLIERDVLVNYSINEISNSIFLTFMDDENVILNIDTGEIM